jgi:hypothetical protein
MSGIEASFIPWHQYAADLSTVAKAQGRQPNLYELVALFQTNGGEFRFTNRFNFRCCIILIRAKTCSLGVANQ